MENLEEQKEYMNKKNLINLLVENGFLKKEEILDSKANERNFKILEYSDEVVDEFLNFMIDKKENSDVKLVDNKIRENKVKKSINHYFYSDLLEDKLDTNKEMFLMILILKIEDLTNNNHIGGDFTLERMQGTTELDYKVKILRDYIRRMKIVPKEIKVNLKKIPYRKKIERIIKSIDYFLQVRDADENWVKLYFYDKKSQMIHSHIFSQLIIYDILHESIPKTERDFGYNEMSNFLDTFIEDFEKRPKKLLKIKTEKASIFIDFFHFLIMREGILKERHIINISKEIVEDLYIGIKPIDKKTQFVYYISRKIAEAKNNNKNLEDILIDCINFIEIPEVKDRMNKEKFSISLKDCEDLFQKFTNKRVFEIMYGTSQVKREFNKINKNLEEVLENFPFLNGSNLQAKKVLSTIIENDKRIIKPFRKTLKALINDKNKELIKTETVQMNMRVRLSKGFFIEKGNSESFKRSIDLELKINKILEKIFILKDENEKIRYGTEFTIQFFEKMISINKDREVIEIYE